MWGVVGRGWPAVDYIPHKVTFVGVVPDRPNHKFQLVSARFVLLGIFKV